MTLILCSLFHVVVDTDVTAQTVLEIMLKERTGRVTFMPLNRLHPKNPPSPNAQDAIPLIDKLNFDPMYEKALQQVFEIDCSKVWIEVNILSSTYYSFTTYLCMFLPVVVLLTAHVR